MRPKATSRSSAELGAHAGPSPEELHTFIVRPASVTLPSPISHPVQLYDHFIRYQDTPGTPGEAAWPGEMKTAR